MSTTENMVQIIYASVASRSFDRGELLTLVAYADASNTALDVTGVLVWDRGSFLQLLEGPALAVDALFDRISADYRHARVSLITRESITARSFSHRPLVFLMPTPAELCEISGSNVFVTRGAGFQRLGLGTIHALLLAAGERRSLDPVRVGAGRPRGRRGCSVMGSAVSRFVRAVRVAGAVGSPGIGSVF